MDDISPRTLRLGVAAIWLLTAGILLWMSVDRLGPLLMWDPDDYMRLQQVRDLLAGQSFFDVSQYRIDPPGGVPMHWSRIPDLPIAGLILLLQPVLGSGLAERIAVSFVPLAIFAGSLGALALIATRLADRRTAMAVAIFAATTPALLFHILPMRIDHHGLQTMLGLTAIAACFDPRARRGGVTAGFAMAAWLAVSLEALPMAAAVAMVLALRFAFGGEDASPCRRLRAFTATLAAAGLGLFALFHGPAAWTQTWCDAFGPAWFGPLVVAPFVVALFAGRAMRHGPAIRIGLLLLAGAGGTALLASTAPACLAGPFAALDPVVTRYWYQNVLEGMPIWRQSAGDQIALAIFPPVGLVGAAIAWRSAPGLIAARNWLAMLMLALAAFAIALLVQRAGGFACALALPGAGWLLVRAMTAIGRWPRATARVAASAAAFLLLSPVGTILAGQIALGLARPADKATKPEPPACARCDSFGAIARLPRTYILAGLDITPRLLINTPHAYAGSAHHRGTAGIRRVIDAFIGAPDIAHRIMRERGMHYVLIDPAGQEAAIYRNAAPEGLMARLLRGDPPPWLKPVRLGTSPLRMWRLVG